ncbi:uncharacterized protein [Nothobranchius furzeri]|uniref:uncharacterized protein n=1 Tax=Nothobranchius furzeri TaxID=105023 RepID=UPI00390467B5
MEAAPPTRGVDGAGARLCTCGNKISSKDPHKVCSSCLGLEHAQLALEVPGSCESCACFTLKSLRRRLARQAILSGKDPCLPAPGPPPGDASEHVLPEPEPCAELSLGSQLEPAGPSHPVEDVLELDYGDDEDTSELLISEEDEDDGVFLPIAQASMPSFPSSPRDGAASPAAHLDMQSVCRRAATRLNIPWPTVVTEAVRSRYEGKKLPQATRPFQLQVSCPRSLLAGLRGDGEGWHASHAADGTAGCSTPAPTALGNFLQASRSPCEGGPLPVGAEREGVQGCRHLGPSFERLLHALGVPSRAL